MAAIHVPLHEPAPLATFCEDRLNSPTPDELDSLTTRTTVRFCKGDTIDYKFLAAVLNKISAAVKKNCLARGEELIEFAVVASNNIDHHPYCDLEGSPDIVAVPSSTAKQLNKAKANPCWYHILSLVENKRAIDMDIGPVKCGTYLALANQARPDMIGMFGIAVSVRGYCIRYSCPSGWESSVVFGWDNLEPLIKYVYTLYRPRTDQEYYDRTITLAKGLSIGDAPKWDVEAEGTIHRNCTVKAVGAPWGRMAWVAQTPGDTPLIIKDNFVGEGTLFRERDLYHLLHQGGVAPGFATICDGFDVKNGETVISVTVRGSKKIKTRLVMGTSGDPLFCCPTVVTFLKVMYDVLEAHRWAVRERGILHRDISNRNIIINAKDVTEPPTFHEEGRPKFITEVLDRTQECAAPLGRLIDLDAAAKYPRDGVLTVESDALSDEEIDLLQYPTGTPRYIARTVACACISIFDTPIDPMPVLDGDALLCYQLAYPIDKDPLRGLSDEGKRTGTVHHGFRDNEKRERYHEDHDLSEEEFLHHPRHDAESVFWCIVVFLLQALPSGRDPNDDANNEWYIDVWQAIAYHEIKDTRIDRRFRFFRICEWQRYLHEDLAQFAPVLRDLADQVRPEYELLTPAPHPLHLHEAMQRILFKCIHKFQNDGHDVHLSTGKMRSTIEYEFITIQAVPVSHQSSSGEDDSDDVHGLKRRSEEMDGSVESNQSKRVKAS